MASNNLIPMHVPECNGLVSAALGQASHRYAKVTLYAAAIGTTTLSRQWIQSQVRSLTADEVVPAAMCLLSE